MDIGRPDLPAKRRRRRITLGIRIDDEEPASRRRRNLFVPFFTTKPGGTGIALVLSRQIAEQNGGRVVLEDRPDRMGARARITLPLAEPGADRKGVTSSSSVASSSDSR